MLQVCTIVQSYELVTVRFIIASTNAKEWSLSLLLRHRIAQEPPEASS